MCLAIEKVVPKRNNFFRQLCFLSAGTQGLHRRSVFVQGAAIPGGHFVFLEHTCVTHKVSFCGLQLFFGIIFDLFLLVRKVCTHRQTHSVHVKAHPAQLEDFHFSSQSTPCFSSSFRHAIARHTAYHFKQTPHILGVSTSAHGALLSPCSSLVCVPQTKDIHNTVSSRSCTFSGSHSHLRALPDSLCGAP